MNGDVLSLQDHFRKVVEQRVAVVVGDVEHAGACGALQGEGHLALSGFQGATYHGKGDGVDAAHE